MAHDAGTADVFNSQDVEAKTQICFDFTKGMCTRGDKCKYSHDIATIVHFNSKEKGICFDYLRNQCHRGLLCRFSHDLSNIAQQCQVRLTLTARSYQLVPDSLGLHAKVYNGAGTRNRTNAICYDFVKGVCQRGTECRYSHDLTLIARTARSNAAARSTEVCYDYLR
jgi:Torus domain/Zinc finger C-x8-C-x5-C-x3-H type (and similar)